MLHSLGNQDTGYERRRAFLSCCFSVLRACSALSPPPLSPAFTYPACACRVQKKRRTHVDVEEEWQSGKMDVPRSFVVRKGQVRQRMHHLVQPATADPLSQQLPPLDHAACM
jgi:hypothetical protein